MRTHGEACATSSPCLAASHAVLAALSPLCPGTAVRPPAVRRAGCSGQPDRANLLRSLCCSYCAFHKDEEGQDVGAFGVFDGCVEGRDRMAAVGCMGLLHLRVVRLAERRRMHARRRLYEHAFFCACCVYCALNRNPPPACRHGGPMAAKFVRDHLFKNLFGHEHFGSNLARAVEDAYQVGSIEGVPLAGARLSCVQELWPAQCDMRPQRAGCEGG